jgi:L-lactate dehydrogenase complex protein LldG
MSEARGDILGAIRRARQAAADPGAVDAHLSDHRRNLVPARATSRDHAGQVTLFAEMAEEVQTTVERVGSLADVPRALADWLAGQNLPAEFVMSPDKLLDDVPWSERPLLQFRRGKPGPTDLTGVTACFAGIAETGTLMLVSGPESPSTLNFLPDNHIAVVRASQIVGTYEDGFDRLRAAGAMPRTVNFVTGPSRTGDIEQKIQLGAHGPRRLHIVVVDGT